MGEAAETTDAPNNDVANGEAEMTPADAEDAAIAPNPPSLRADVAELPRKEGKRGEKAP